MGRKKSTPKRNIDAVFGTAENTSGSIAQALDDQATKLNEKQDDALLDLVDSDSESEAGEEKKENEVKRKRLRKLDEKNDEEKNEVVEEANNVVSTTNETSSAMTSSTSTDTDSSLVQKLPPLLEVIKCNRKSCKTIFKFMLSPSDVIPCQSYDEEDVIWKYDMSMTNIEINSAAEYKSLQIKNEDAIRQLIKNVNSRLKPRRMSKSDPPIENAIQIDVEDILPALQHELLEVYLQTYQQEESTFSTKICVHLTSKAYEHLSPYQSTLSRSTLRKIQTQKRVNDRMLACFIQQAFGTLFQQSCMKDLLVVKKKAKKEMEGEITSKMIYKIVDNAKSHRFEAGSTRDKLGPIPGLVPKLRKYQEAAVEWMLERERGEYSDHCWELGWVAIPISSESTTTVVPLYTLGGNGHTQFRFYNPFNGWLVKDYAVAKESTIGTDAQIYGGILSESMGLGKTVEVLSCILANPKPIPTDSDLQQENLESKNDQDYMEKLTTEHVSFDDVDFNGICYCGRAGFTKSALSQVFCRGCLQPMHGICAGFRSMDEVNASVKKVYKVSDNSESQNAKKRVANICNEGRCLHCSLAHHTNGKEIESRATLIVTPPSILSQWEREIKRHTLVKSTGGHGQDTVTPLKVKVYRGVRELCSMSHKEALAGNQRCLLNPICLSDADIVLTTFPVLMTDLLHSDDNPYIANERAGRKRGRGRRIVPTPLISIKWWRVVLDEAQRVETPTAASARMALKLLSRYRWCVSGTPVGRGKMEDLYGLLLFLGLRPFNEKDWFKHLIKSNFGDVDARIAHLLKECLWRSTKANESVRQQMGIPEQIEKKIFLDFSSVEKHFYQRQLEETILAANSVIDRANKARNTKKCDLLSHQLHRLRAACCHPQVGSSGIGKTGTKTASVANGVLSMSQILDRLIDDAKIQAEESQRLFTLNTNAIACLYKLKAESGNRAGSLVDSEEEIALLTKSCNAYFKAINVADSNSSPSSIVGEAVLTGNSGFQSPHAVIRDGRATLAWTLSTDEDSSSMPEIFARFDFSGPTKKITKLAVRYSVAEKNDTQLLYPKDCVLQVQNSAIGGLFVDALPFTLVRPHSEGGELSTDTTFHWQEFESFRPNKSKSWRIYIKNYHDNGPSKQGKVTVSIDVQLMEPDIIPDTLQRMHILHNNIISLTLLKEKAHEVSTEKTECIKDTNIKYEEIEDKTSKMRAEKETLESHYVEAAKALQLSSQVKLDESISEREKIQNELMRVDRSKCDEDYFPWWQDLFGLCHLHPNPRLQLSLSEFVEGALFDLFNNPSQPFAGRSFPEVDNLDGLNIALSMRIQDNCFYSNVIQNEMYTCVRKIQKLSESPSEADVLSNSHCHKCRSDWDQKGPKCIPCQLEEELIEHQTSVKDTIIHCVLQSMFTWLRQNSSKFSPNLSAASGAISIKNLLKKAELFFNLRDAVIKELDSAKSKWRTHLDLLSDIDEMNQCQRSMRLAYEDENLYGLTPHEQAFIVQPYNITRLLHEHTAKQAMAEGSLRKSKELLRYLKNQNLERIQSESNKTNEAEPCLICLCPFEKERAVLRCGHVYHFSPCLENLLQRCGGHTISCPLRCAIRTKKEEILIASDICKDDGSKISRKIEGQWGTKVDRLVSDLMSVVEIGEKAIVFSQWDDMLKIMEHALTANSLKYVRPKSIKKFGESMAIFRSNNCNLMLLNFKHGAEGLTLVEANHIFMIEPLLNHSIDSQAINRIHRIGQTSKTYIHRYIINETIETKIDAKRMQRQDHEGEEEEDVIECRQTLNAGGLDGGLDEAELQALLS